MEKSWQLFADLRLPMYGSETIYGFSGQRENVNDCVKPLDPVHVAGCLNLQELMSVSMVNWRDRLMKVLDEGVR